MHFPKDVIVIIREFSQPITRPNWRTLHRMTIYKLHFEIRKKYNKFNIPVINSFVKRHSQTQERVDSIEPKIYCLYLFMYVIMSLSILVLLSGLLMVTSYRSH